MGQSGYGVNMAWVGLVVWSLWGCSSADDLPERTPLVGSGGVAGTGGIGGQVASGGAVTSGGAVVTGGIGGGGSTAPTGGSDEEGDDCGQSVSAPPPAGGQVDIVWVVDASGSMLDEQIRIGQNITQFADDITSAAVDVQIVMLTTSAGIPVICPVTDPDPAAATALAGDPRYHFINASVDSRNLLDIALSSYPTYQQFLRPGAATHFIFVSDDESNFRGLPNSGARAAEFQTAMEGQLGQPFFAHTISSEGPSACSTPNCMPDPNSGLCVFAMLGCGASAPGATYWDLAGLTDGLTASICQEDWSGIFAPLTIAIVESVPLPCNYPIPPTPLDQTFSRDKVNVEFTPPGETEAVVFPRVNDDVADGGEAACGDNVAWYFGVDDGMPNEIRLCPSACLAVEDGGGINVSFGCVAHILM